VPIAREPPPLPRGRLTYSYPSPPTTDRQTDRQTDTTSDQQRLGTPPSCRPGVGGSLPPLSCFSYPANQATSAASRFVSWKMGRHTRARWRLDRGRMNDTWWTVLCIIERLLPLASKPQHSACLLRYRTVLCMTCPIPRGSFRCTQHTESSAHRPSLTTGPHLAPPTQAIVFDCMVHTAHRHLRSELKINWLSDFTAQSQDQVPRLRPQGGR
jgi:hypothetical protein